MSGWIKCNQRRVFRAQKQQAAAVLIVAEASSFFLPLPVIVDMADGYFDTKNERLLPDSKSKLDVEDDDVFGSQTGKNMKCV